MSLTADFILCDVKVAYILIDRVLTLLKDILESHIDTDGAPTSPKVVFPEGPAKGQDAIVFKQAVNVILLHLEQDNVLRPPERYTRMLPDGSPVRVHPEVRINLSVMFVSNFNDYKLSLNYLSRIIQFFQRHSLFTHQNTPNLPDEVDQLIVELVTPTISEQNDIWNGLRLHYHPSVIYRVKTLVYRDPIPSLETPISEIRTDLFDTKTPPKHTSP